MPPLGGDNASIRTTSTRAPSFTLDTFSNKDFIVKDFVENLTEAATPASRRSGPSSQQQAFDPKPLIRAFEHALGNLNRLSDELEERENDMSGAVRKAENAHNANVADLGRKLDQAMIKFQRLDSSLNGSASDDPQDVGGNRAVRIGEELEELDRQRQRSQDARFLIQCWVDVSEKGDLTILEEMRRSRRPDGKDKVRCAHIARQLLKISARLDPDGSQNINGAGRAVNGTKKRGGNQSKFPTREIIEKFLENLEQDLLEEFNETYRKMNYEGMRDCAVALRDFNDGASVMATYVNQHGFFIDRTQLVTDEVVGDAETWERLNDPDAEPPGVEPSLQSLIDEVRIVVQEESLTIKRAFPYYEEVLIRFIQRIFQQSIQQRLEMVLDKAAKFSSLAFLRSLQAARSYIATLVDELKTHGLTEHPEPVTSQIAAVLDQQLEDLFVPYFVGTSYIEREKKNLEELYSSLLLKFTIYHSRRRKMPTSYFSSLRQQGKDMFQNARDVYMERLAADLPEQHKALLRRVAGLKDADSDKKEIEITEEDGKLSLANAKRMLKWLAEGVGRGLEMSPSNETPKDVQNLLNLLLANMGEIYLETALDAASDHAASQENIKNPPDLTHLPLLHTSITILHLLQTSTSTVLLPLATPNLTIRREIDKATTNTLATLESKISTIIVKTLDASLNWVSRCLAQQKKTDFRPKDDADMAVILGNETPACQAVVQFLNRVAGQATAALDGRNLHLFLSELARGLRTLVLEHLRKFTVNVTGALVAKKDMNAYVDLVRGWPTGDMLEANAMDILTDVANLFVIPADALKERLRVSGPEAQELKAYIMKREDSGSVGVQSAVNGV